jgi:hypothetical protein
MSFNYAVTITDPNKLVDDAALLACTNAALEEWSAVLSGAGTLTIEVTVSVNPANPFGTANGGSTTSVFLQKDGNLNELLYSATYALLTGTHANGVPFDGHINIDPNFFKNGWSNISQPLPANAYGITDVMAHELGHVFGFNSFKDTSTGLATQSAESVWDTYLKIAPGGSTTFNGPRAITAYGGPVPVTTTLVNGSNAPFYSHIGNTPADKLGSIDVMSGIGAALGTPHPVSAVDVAILGDVLNPVTSTQRAAKISQDDSAGAVLEIFQAMTGSTPKLIDFASFVQTVVSIESVAGSSGGAANGWVGLGASLADSKFAPVFTQKFAALADSTFVTSGFTEVFGTAPSTAKGATGQSQTDLMVQEYNIFKAYYAASPDSTDPTGVIRARGAYLADLLHQGSDANIGRYASAEDAMLAHAATHPADFGSSLFTAFA